MARRTTRPPAEVPEPPPESSIRKVFRLVDLIRRAGYAPQEQELEAAV